MHVFFFSVIAHRFPQFFFGIKLVNIIYKEERYVVPIVFSRRRLETKDDERTETKEEEKNVTREAERRKRFVSRYLIEKYRR